MKDAQPRPLGFGSLLALGLNGIIGVGIFFTPAEIALVAPAGQSPWVFALTAVFLAPVAIAFFALSRRFVEDGGPVVYARAAFSPAIAFAVGWMAYVSAVASTASTCAGLAHALAPASFPGGDRALGVLLATVLAGVAALGLVPSARVWTTLTVLKLVPLLALAGAVLFVSPVSLARPLQEPLAHEGSWLRAALLATFAFQGFEIVPLVSGQARAPERSIPLSTAASLALSTALYLALQVACVRALGDGLGRSEAPLADAAFAYGGHALRSLLAWGTSLSSLGIAFGMMSMTPRYLASVAERERFAVPLATPPTRGVPLRALTITWGLVVALLAALGERLSPLLELASVAVLSQYASTALALAVLSARRAHGFGSRGLFVAVPALVTPALLMAQGTSREWLVAGAALALGFALRRRAAA